MSETDTRAVCDFNVTLSKSSVEANIKDLNAFVDEIVRNYRDSNTSVTVANKQKCKDDLASVRKLIKQVSGKMTSVKKELLLPFDEINAQVKAATARLQEIETEMASAIKRVEDEQRQALIAGRQEIVSAVVAAQESDVRDIVEGYWDVRWNNLSITDNEIRGDIQDVCQKARMCLDAVKGNRHEAQLIACFVNSFSYDAVLQEKERLERNDAEYERMQERRLAEEMARKQKEAERRLAEEMARKQKEAERLRQEEADKALEGMMPQSEPAPVEQPAPATKDRSADEIVTAFRVLGTIADIKAVVDFAAEHGVQMRRVDQIEKATDELRNKYRFN